MFKKLNFFLIVLGVFLIMVSCEDQNEFEADSEPDMPPIENTDSIIVPIITTCNSLQSGEITFEYQDSIYHILNPEKEILIDTFNLNSIFSVYYRSIIAIRAPLNTNQEISILISHYDTVQHDCMPTITFFEQNDYDGEDYCFDYENGFGIYPICSGMRAKLVTVVSPVSTASSHADEGSLEILHCENGNISGIFENDFFKNGQFCNIIIN